MYLKQDIISVQESINIDKKVCYEYQRQLLSSRLKELKEKREKEEKDTKQMPFFVELLNQTQHHDEDYEKLKLQKLKEDCARRKQLMMVRVIGLSKFAEDLKFFNDV